MNPNEAKDELIGNTLLTSKGLIEQLYTLVRQTGFGDVVKQNMVDIDASLNALNSLQSKVLIDIETAEDGVREIGLAIDLIDANLPRITHKGSLEKIKEIRARKQKSLDTLSTAIQSTKAK